jgi:hypothetical protein
VVRLYHWTRRDNVNAILGGGFRETTSREPRGVHLSAHPTAYWRGFNDVCVVVEFPDDLNIEQWRDREATELVGVADYIIPASVISDTATLSVPP